MCSSACDLSTVSACRWDLLDSPPAPSSPARRSDQGRVTGGQPQGPRCRHRHSAACVGDYVYVFGGREGTSPRKDVWSFHVGSWTWTAVELQGAKLPFLQGHTSVVFQKLVLIFGGTFSDSMGDLQLWTFHSDTGRVEELRFKPAVPQPSCRRDHSAVVHNNTMYVYGGFAGSRGANQEMWAFSTEDMAWREVRPLRGGGPGGRYSHSAVVVDNAMWLCAGLAGLQPKADLWRYSFLLHQWKKVKALGSPPCLSGHTASVVQRHMVVVGGKSQGRAVSEVWCFSLDTSTWQQVSQLSSLLPRLSFHTCVSYSPPPQPPAEACVQHLTSGQSVTSAAGHARGGRSRVGSTPLTSDKKAWVSFQSSQRGTEAETRVWSAKGNVEATVSRCRPGDDRQTDLDHDLDHNAANFSDTRVHVSSKEALICPDSPEMDILSNRKHLVKDASGYLQLDEEYAQESMPYGSVGNVHSVYSSKNSSDQTVLQTLSPGCSSEKSVPDLIDLSGSPVQKLSSLKQDLLLEELDLLGRPGQNEVSASGPLENPYSLRQCQSLRTLENPYSLRQCQSLRTEVAALSGVCDDALLPAQSPWNPCECGSQTMASSAWRQPDLQLWHHSGDVLLKPVAPATAAERHAHSPQSTEGSVTAEDSKITSSEGQVGKDSVDQHHARQQHNTCRPTEPLTQQSQSSPSQPATKQWQTSCASPTSQPGWCESVGVVDTAEDVFLIPPERGLGAESKNRLNMSALRSRDNAMSGAASEKRERKSREGMYGRRERAKARIVCTGTEAEPGKECLLVLGGHWEGQGTGLAKPMPVWKGFVL